MSRRRSIKHSRLLALIGLAALGVASCGGADAGSTGGGITVVATTTILGDVAANVVGDDGSVVALTPIGADPHDYQASAAQVAALNDADLVIANGLGLEEGIEDALDAAARDGVNLLELGPLLDPIPFGAGTDPAHGADESDHGSDDDPHVWLDPLRMATAAELIADRLAAIEPNIDWVKRTNAYATELVAADDEIVEILSRIPAARRRLVTNHDSMEYFADRYEFEVIGVVIPGGSTLADPSSQELAELVHVMQQEQVNAIFAETTQATALAEAVAAELGEDVTVTSLFTGSLGEPSSEAGTLIGMLRTNATRIAGALTG